MKLLMAFLFVIFSVNSFSSESAYQKILAPIKKIKLAEKKSGNSNPVFDEVKEADLPDELLNNKTLEGIDSNNDGVRDDVEIWINRKAEDEFVRWALKDYYKKLIAVLNSVEQKQKLEEIKARSTEFNDSVYCTFVMLRPYDEPKKKSKRKRDPVVVYMTELGQLILNTPLRVNTQANWNDYPVAKSTSEEADKYCLGSPVGKRYESLKMKELMNQNTKPKK